MIASPGPLATLKAMTKDGDGDGDDEDDVQYTNSTERSLEQRLDKTTGLTVWDTANVKIEVKRKHKGAYPCSQIHVRAFS